MADTASTDSRARMTGTVPPSKILTTEIPRYVDRLSSTAAGDPGHGLRRRRRARRTRHRRRDRLHRPATALGGRRDSADRR